MKKLIASIALGLAVLGFAGASFAQAASAPEVGGVGRRHGGPAAGGRTGRSGLGRRGPGARAQQGRHRVHDDAPPRSSILMTIPGLALFYGGLVRSKNMLSVLMQVFMIFALISVLWVVYGYSLAFTAGNPFIGTLDKLFLKGVTPDSIAATFSKGVVLPELTFVAFQGTFAAITAALIVGAFAERMKFSAVLLFVGAVVHLRLPADRAHGLVLGRPGRDHQRRDAGHGDRQRRLHVGQGCARLRRRHGGAHQRGDRRPGRAPT